MAPTRLSSGDRPDCLFEGDDVFDCGLSGRPLDVRGVWPEPPQTLFPSHLLFDEPSREKFMLCSTLAEGDMLGYRWNAADNPKSAILSVFSSSGVPSKPWLVSLATGLVCIRRFFKNEAEENVVRNKPAKT